MFGGDEAMVMSSLWASMATWFTPTVLFCVLNLMIAFIFVASNFKSPDPPGQLARPPSLLQRVSSVSLSGFRSTPEAQDAYPFPSGDAGYDSPGELDQNRSVWGGDGPNTAGNRTDSASQLGRAPSVLERVKSIGFSSFFAQDYNNPFPAEAEQIHDSPGQLARAPSLLDRVKSFKISPFKPESEVSRPDPRHDTTNDVVRSESDMSPAKKSTRKMKKSRSERRVAAAAADGGEEDVDRRRPATMKEAGTASFGPPEDEIGVDSKADDFINRFKQQLKLQRLDSLLRYREMLNRGT